MNVNPITFWSNVDRRGPDECWVWLRRLEKGYGKLAYREGGKMVSALAHRIAYLLAVGVIGDGLMVLHSCDNRACCNPRHLFLGDALVNAQDCVRKGRQGRRGRRPRNTPVE